MRLSIDKEKCILCGWCEQVCPSLAIHPAEQQIDETCISCFQCSAVCKVQAISVDNEVPKQLVDHSISSTQFEALLKSRRSTRVFKNEPIDSELLERFIKNLSNSPTASNSRIVEVVIVTDSTKLSTLNDSVFNSLLAIYKKFTNPLVYPIVKLLLGEGASKLIHYRENFIRKRAINSNLIVYDAPVVLLIHQKKSMTGLPDADCNIFASFAMLYAETLGLSTCYNGFIVKILEKNKKLAAEYGIPKSNKIYAALLLGYPKVKYHNEAIRESVKIEVI